MSEYMWAAKDSMQTALGNVQIALDALHSAREIMADAEVVFDFPVEASPKELIQSIDDAIETLGRAQENGVQKTAAFEQTLMAQDLETSDGR